MKTDASKKLFRRAKRAIPGGVNGDIATCAITLNAVFAIVNCAPGLSPKCDDA